MSEWPECPLPTLDVSEVPSKVLRKGSQSLTIQNGEFVCWKSGKSAMIITDHSREISVRGFGMDTGHDYLVYSLPELPSNLHSIYIDIIKKVRGLLHKSGHFTFQVRSEDPFMNGLQIDINSRSPSKMTVDLTRPKQWKIRVLTKDQASDVTRRVHMISDMRGGRRHQTKELMSIELQMQCAFTADLFRSLAQRIPVSKMPSLINLSAKRKKKSRVRREGYATPIHRSGTEDDSDSAESTIHETGSVSDGSVTVFSEGTGRGEWKKSRAILRRKELKNSDDRSGDSTGLRSLSKLEPLIVGTGHRGLIEEEKHGDMSSSVIADEVSYGLDLNITEDEYSTQCRSTIADPCSWIEFQDRTQFSFRSGLTMIYCFLDRTLHVVLPGKSNSSVVLRLDSHTERQLSKIRHCDSATVSKIRWITGLLGYGQNSVGSQLK